MEYDSRAIERKWQRYWEEHEVYKVPNRSDKPKFYTLVMFPYPSGAGLHVGHPLGYIAADIYARYKRLNGFNVLHPMGFDAFGLPAEQYAIQTGQHPAETTRKNIARYKEQLKLMGFSYDWSREVWTCNPDYYKWTQWIFLQLFHHWYNQETDRAEPIEKLEVRFAERGTEGLQAACGRELSFRAEEWHAMSETERQKVLLNYRLAYTDYTMVNWCPELGTVLANDEVKEGLSVRGGFPVVRRPMRQWFLRITAYAERLLEGLGRLNWPEPLKEMQRNWIGRSEGASIRFPLDGREETIEVFTTRPDTVFGATFMVLAPEHELVKKITTPDREQEVNDYLEYVQSRSERDRISEVRTVTGAFTGAYAVNPFTKEKISVWISEYVLASYGTGAIMAVPAHDSRDYAFAKKFGLPIVQVIEGADITRESYDDKSGKMMNSGFLNGLDVQEAIPKIIEEIERQHLGKGRVNYKIRDAGFSRQRYWGEPFPIVYREEIPYALSWEELPLELPELDDFRPTGTGESPLARLADWVNLPDGSQRETDTMPGYAGSSWYFLRYMDAHNEQAFAGREALEYWRDVDLYIGGAEHAVGHLMYARFWHKFLYDLGLVPTDEPFKTMINQGMIQGMSSLAYRVVGEQKFVSKGLAKNYKTIPIHVDVNLVHHNVLDVDAFKKSMPDYAEYAFELEDGKFICGTEVEKMSKSKFNVVNPDDIIEKYGADTFRMYEMFLGPIEAHKPWDTNGIDGVYKFLRKYWNLFFDRDGRWRVTEEEPSVDELRVLHKTIKKVREDIERCSFNTAVSAFMICVNELTGLGCHSREVLEPLTVLLAPFAPHITEELWERLGHEPTVHDARYPVYDEQCLVVDEVEYPVSVNGKMRTRIRVPAGFAQEEIEQEVLANEVVQRWLEGRSPRKIIVVPGRIVNIVV